MSNAKFLVGLLLLSGILGLLLNSITVDVCQGGIIENISRSDAEIEEQLKGVGEIKYVPAGCIELLVVDYLIFIPIGLALLYLASPFHQ